MHFSHQNGKPTIFYKVVGHSDELFRINPKNGSTLTNDPGRIATGAASIEYHRNNLTKDDFPVTIALHNRDREVSRFQVELDCCVGKFSETNIETG